jgi:hypothetical protein
MSDRTISLTVVLDDTYRVDDIQEVVGAIRMIKGISSVGVNVADSDSYIAYNRARTDLTNKILDILLKE